jgi:type II secretory pathway pseudopilin PulG
MMRKAFSMITAVFVIIIMATLAIFVLNLAGKITQETAVQYRQEQAALLARSYTELAVLAVINHDRNQSTPSCIENIDGAVNGLLPGGAVTGNSGGSSGGYYVETRIYYIGDGLPCSETRKLNDSNSTMNSPTTLQTDYNNTAASDAIAAIMVDVFVSYKDPDAPNNLIKYHRRTLQKI